MSSLDHVTLSIGVDPTRKEEASKIETHYVWVPCPQSAMSYPVILSCWNIFEDALRDQAKEMVKDIAKHQGVDWKDLWDKVRPTIKVPLLNADVSEQPFCTHLMEKGTSRVIERCRAPCLLGYEYCPSHLSSPTPVSRGIDPVDRILDHEGTTYFVDSRSVAKDSSGVVKGMVEDGVLYLFQRSDTVRQAEE